MHIAVVLLVIIVNAFFVLVEIAIIVANKIKLRKAEKTGAKGAQIALDLTSIPEQFLSTSLMASTLVDIILGIYGATTISDNITEIMNENNFLTGWSKGIGDIIAIVFVTYMIALGDLIPKRIAMLYPEEIAIRYAHIMKVFLYLIYPLARLLGNLIQSYTKTKQKSIRQINQRHMTKSN